jgi:dihydrofolate reductase
MNQTIVLIYARAANGAIGKDGTLPWHLPADLRHFKSLTIGPDGKGRPMIMGRKTFESLPGMLPGRRHIVLTRREDWDSGEAEIARTAAEALELAGEGEVAVIGGAAIYDVFMALADRIELTEVHAEFDGDTFMPDIGAEWAEIARNDHPKDERHPAYSFVTYERAS